MFVGYPATMGNNEDIHLNSRTAELVRAIVHRADVFAIEVHTAACGTTLVDFGINVPGNRLAAVQLAQVCLADLADVAVDDSTTPWQRVKV